MKSFPLMRDGNGSVLLDPFGLSGKERITSAREFERAYKKGAISRSGCLVIRSLPNNLGYSRLGIAVSKKSFPGAVTRNRIKRLVREAFRLNKRQLPKGLDLIVGVRPKGPESFIPHIISVTTKLKAPKYKLCAGFTLQEIKSCLTDVFSHKS